MVAWAAVMRTVISQCLFDAIADLAAVYRRLATRERERVCGSRKKHLRRSSYRRSPSLDLSQWLGHQSPVEQHG